MEDKKIKFAICGFKNSFDLDQIGGTDSIVRRLTNAIKEKGHIVDYFLYGYANESSKIIKGSRIYYLKKYKDMINILAGEYNHIVTVYIKKCDRIKFMFYRKKNDSMVIFHHVYSVWPEFWIKRMLMFADTRLIHYNGRLFNVSPRLHQFTSSWSNRTEMLLPPVPQDYFIKPSEKPKSSKLQVAFVGRIDPGKGTPDAIELFKKLSSHKQIETKIFGFPWKHRPETMKLHNELLTQSEIYYEPVEYHNWSPQVCQNLLDQLRHIDILVLPYKKLSSTIDIPLLLLEGMANLCAVITPNLGDLHNIYGESPFNLPADWDNKKAYEIIINASNYIKEEIFRVYEQCSILKFDTLTITNKFLQKIEN